MSYCCSQASSLHSEVTGTFKVRFSIFLPGLSLAQCVWMGKRGRGWSCSFCPWGTLSLTHSSWLQRSSLELCSFSPELRPRAGSLMKKRWVGSCRSDVVMVLVLRWFHQWRPEAWGFHCLLCLSSWNLREKHWFGELFRIIAPSLFYHLHVCAAVTLIWCATWIT